ncbi:BrnT family toxin [Citrobacter braakii]|uniref:BrnT family toxin n=1 Tax=Citrobacter braakii TaxID=57706 RepID=UPI004039204A
MIITFDPTKNQTNKLKHGVFLSDARHLEWDALVAVEDTDLQYGEMRYSGLTYGLAHLGNRVYAVVFTYDDSGCDEVYRIISLRKATKVEVQKYAKT